MGRPKRIKNNEEQFQDIVREHHEMWNLSKTARYITEIFEDEGLGEYDNDKEDFADREIEMMRIAMDTFAYPEETDYYTLVKIKWRSEFGDKIARERIEISRRREKKNKMLIKKKKRQKLAKKFKHI